MAFFTNSILSESYGYLPPVEEGSNKFLGTEYESEDFCANFITEAYAIESALYAADSMLEHAVFEGYGDPDVLIENALTNAIEKVKAKIIELWTSIKKWIIKTRDNLKIFVVANSKFIYKHEEAIKKNAKAIGEGKAVNKFEFKGYSFKGATDTTSKVTDLINKEITEETLSNIEKGLGESVTTSELLSKIVGNDFGANVDSVAALATEITKAYNGSEEPETIGKDDLGDIGTWMTEVKGAKSAIEGIRKLEADATKKFNTIIKSLDKAKSEAKKADTDKAIKKDNVSHINRTIKIANFSASVTSKLVSTLINCHMRRYKQYTSICKAVKAASIKKDETATESFGTDAFSAALDYFL